MESCIEFISASAPKVFVLENVKGMVTWRRGAFFLELLGRLRAIGSERYCVSRTVLSTHDHGVPQRRARLYIVGVRKDVSDCPFAFPPAIAPMPLADLLFSAGVDPEALLPMASFTSPERSRLASHGLHILRGKRG